MHTLDRSRDYSPIYGDSGAKFYQDGRYFDATGAEVSAEVAAAKNQGLQSLPLAAPAEPEPVIPPTDAPPPTGDEPFNQEEPPVLTEPVTIIAPEALAQEAEAIAELAANPMPATESAPGVDANGSPVEG